MPLSEEQHQHLICPPDYTSSTLRVENHAHAQPRHDAEWKIEIHAEGQTDNVKQTSHIHRTYGRQVCTCKTRQSAVCQQRLRRKNSRCRLSLAALQQSLPSSPQSIAVCHTRYTNASAVAIYCCRSRDTPASNSFFAAHALIRAVQEF